MKLLGLYERGNGGSYERGKGGSYEREKEGVEREGRERVTRERERERKREKRGSNEREDLWFIFFFICLKVRLECKEVHFGKSLSSHQICS